MELGQGLQPAKNKGLKKVGMLELLRNVVDHLLLAQPFGTAASLGTYG